MCSKARFIAGVCTRILETTKTENLRLEKIKESAFYTAPEACHLLWNDIFKVVVKDYKDHGEVCKIYNESFRKYTKLDYK